MVLTTYKKKGIRLTHVWFASEAELADLAKGRRGTDIFYVHGTSYTDSPCSLLVFRQKSLIKHIPSSEEAVWATYGKHLKAYIKRSQKEDVAIRIFRGKQITGEVLDICGGLYEQMKADKGIPDPFNRSLAEIYAREDALVLVLAYVGGEAVGFNAYIADRTHFRAWLTAFAFRQETNDAQVISRAHQQLEWDAMRYCCQNGITSYDFGGITSFETPNGIDKFKMNFAKEGQQVAYDNFLLGSSLLGKAGIAAYKLYKKIKK